MHLLPTRLHGWQVLGVLVSGSGACAANGPQMQSAGAWGTIAPRVYRNRVTREEATILLEAPAWITVFEQSQAYTGDRLRLLFPTEGDSTLRLPAGRHRLRFPVLVEGSWAPSVTLIVFAMDHAVPMSTLLEVELEVSPSQSASDVVNQLAVMLLPGAGPARWEGFLYHLDMWRPGGGRR